MKPELTQAEMKKLAAEGKTHIWAYNTLYAVEFCRNLGNGEYYLMKLLTRPHHGMGVTKRGRFMAMEPEEAFKYVGT